MVRGIERRAIFRDDRDRDDFVRRLAELAAAGAVTVQAWALLPNHAHLLVRTGKRPLARAMRSLLTGYAGAFNRRHQRHGHLFQNRYKSVVVEAEAYGLELVRYLHLNPLRAGVVPDLAALRRYRYSGHAALVGRRPAPWQDTREVWGRFGGDTRSARQRYQEFVAAGVSQGRRPEFQGGGLRRSAGGWQAVRELRRGREAYRSDERILGGTAFVTQLLAMVEAGPARAGPRVSVETLRGAVCKAIGVDPTMLAGGGRRPAVVAARAGIAYLWTEVPGRPGRPLAPLLGTRPAAVYRAAARGRAHAPRWRRVLADVRKET
jgi:REP element-mobilizing transposase RayT